MRILLVQPNGGHGHGFHGTALLEPLGLEAVAGALEGHEVRLLDLRVEKGLADAVDRFHPEVCGINCSFTVDVCGALYVARVAKTAGDGEPPFVVVGGHHASLNPADFRDRAVDAIALGEGEGTAAELAACLERGENPRSVAGLVLNSPAGQVRTGVRRLAQRLDDLPLPARGLARGHRDSYHLFTHRPVAAVETARGCPHRCSFCSVWRFYRRRYRAKSAERVVAEVSAIEEPTILFTDDNFLADADRAWRIAVLLLGGGLRHRYVFQARSDGIAENPDLIKLWAKAGLEAVFVGLEKTDQEGLSSVRKDNSVASNERALELLRREGVGAMASFIVDPEWERTDFDALRTYLGSHRIETPSFTVSTPLPGTELHQRRRDQVQTADCELYDLLHAVVPTRLPLPEFYGELASLYRAGYPRGRWLLEAARALGRGRSPGNLALLPSLVKAAGRLGSAREYVAGHERASRACIERPSRAG
ncbi:MAG: radical SAM protein [Dehalococcoidales bacterium]|nr:radical SAM protein [Dehalococcoidales bacterium]